MSAKTPKAKTPTRAKPEDSHIWQETCDLAEYIYAKIAELPDDEKWYSAAKLRTSAIDLLFYTSQAVGNASPGSLEYDWGQARKCAFALKTMYRFVCRQKYIEIEPSVMVRLDKLVEEIDANVQLALKQTAEFNAKDIELWQRKYTMWKAANTEGNAQ